MTTPNFKNMWPTQLMEINLPGHDQANPVLAEYLEKIDVERAQMTTNYLSDNLFDKPHPILQWLKQSIERAVVDYSQHLGIDYSIDFKVQGWGNVNRLGDYHNLHNHPRSWLSGTYYAAVPEQDTLPSGRDDRTPNCISFFDPRPQANMNAIRGDGQFDPEYRIKPTPGLLILWPAFLHHLVHPNLSRETRISVSFNIVARWKDEYLPS